MSLRSTHRSTPVLHSPRRRWWRWWASRGGHLASRSDWTRKSSSCCPAASRTIPPRGPPSSRSWRGSRCSYPPPPYLSRYHRPPA
eukprot:957252-Prorocentrum_minimum.AAC.1